MFFFSLPGAIALLLACASCSLAQDATDGFDAFQQPDTELENIPAGKVYTVTWEPSPPYGNISILLMQGPTEETQDLKDPIVSAWPSVNGEFKWNVPTDLVPAGTYGLKLQLDSNITIFQYSVAFIITGLDGNKTSAVPSSAAASSVSTSTTSSAKPSSTESSTSASAATSATGSSTATSTASSGTAAPATATSPSTPTPASTATASKASKAWIAGAVVGPIVLIAIIAAVLLYVRHLRRELRQQKEGAATSEAAHKPAGYYGAGGQLTQMHEVDGNMVPIEIGNGRRAGPRSELP